MIKQLQATRTCSVCGQKKPLVAFLELAGDKGHTYGDICATCRGSGLGRKKPGEEGAGQSGETARLQLDIKTKIQLDHDRKEQAKEHTDRDYEEKVKKEGAEAEESSEAEERKEAEKKYREGYLEQRKQSTTRSPDKADATPAAKESQVPQAQGFYQEKARATKDAHQQVVDQQFGKKTQGLTAEYINKYVAASGRSAESLFGNLLGQFMRTHLQTQNKATSPSSGQNKNSQPGKTAQAAASGESGKQQEAGKNESSESQENTATEFVRNNFNKR